MSFGLDGGGRDGRTSFSKKVGLISKRKEVLNMGMNITKSLDMTWLETKSRRCERI